MNKKIALLTLAFIFIGFFACPCLALSGFDIGGVIVSDGEYYFASDGAFKCFSPGTNTLKNISATAPYIWAWNYSTEEILVLTTSEIGVGKNPKEIKTFRPKSQAIDFSTFADNDLKFLKSKDNLLVAYYNLLIDVTLSDFSEKNIDAKKLGNEAICGLLTLDEKNVVVYNSRALASYDRASASFTKTLEIIDENFPTTPARIDDVCVGSSEILALTEYGIFRVPQAMDSFKKIELSAEVSKALFPRNNDERQDNISAVESKFVKKIYRAGNSVFIFSRGSAYKIDLSDISTLSDETSKFSSDIITYTGVSRALLSAPYFAEYSPSKNLFVTEYDINIFDQANSSLIKVKKPTGKINNLSIVDSKVVFTIGDGIFELTPGSVPEAVQIRKPSNFVICEAPGLKKTTKILCGPGSIFIETDGKAIVKDLSGSRLLDLTKWNNLSDTVSGKAVPKDDNARPSAVGSKFVSTNEVGFIESSSNYFIAVDLRSQQVAAKEIIGVYPFDFAVDSDSIFFVGTTTRPMRFSPSLPRGEITPATPPGHILVSGKIASKLYAFDASENIAEKLNLPKNSVVKTPDPYFEPEPIVIGPDMKDEEIVKMRAENKKRMKEKRDSAIAEIIIKELDGARYSNFIFAGGSKLFLSLFDAAGTPQIAAIDVSTPGRPKLSSAEKFHEYSNYTASKDFIVLNGETQPVILKKDEAGKFKDVTSEAASKLNIARSVVPFDYDARCAFASIDTFENIVISGADFAPLSGRTIVPSPDKKPSSIIYAGGSSVIYLSRARLICVSFE